MWFLYITTATRIVLLASCLSAFAQIGRFPGQWVGDFFSVEDAMNKSAIYLVDRDCIVREEISSVSYIDDFPIAREHRRGILNSVWFNDALYSLAYGSDPFEKDAEGTSFRRLIFAKWQDDEWHYLGEYKHVHPTLRLQAIPCDNDRFIVISEKEDLAGNTGSQITPFVRMAVDIDKKVVRVHSSIDHGQDDLRQYMSKQTCFDMAFRSHIIATGNLATLLNYKTGLYWTFSMETATLKKTGNIFSRVEPEMVAAGGWTDAILCAHPEKDGTILVSALEEGLFTTQDDYVAEMRELAEVHNLNRPDATMTQGEWAKLYMNRRTQVVNQNSAIVWYRLHPESGKVEKIIPPEGAAIDREKGMKDLWHPKPDGSVQMTSVALKLETGETMETEKRDFLVKQADPILDPQ
ncbi:MAG: hypothetical protein FWG12_06825 [Holophagaceae bacterium]|nr:hypothetical protein [Holophagaceae bacterium]